MEIQIRALTKSYGPKTALDGVSLTIGNGMFGLLGRNGAGKTTLMQILSTLQRPTSGSVTFDGIPLEDARRIRPLVGFLPQEFSLYPDLSVLEIMRYLSALSGLPAEVRRRRIPDLLQRVNLWEERGKKAGRLSGGMKRRLGVAGALLHNPQVLIADEPTAGLDPQERRRFYDLLGGFSGDRIVIVSSHIVGDIQSVCERAAVLDGGKLLFAGTVQDLARTAEGKVYELTVPRRAQASVRREYCVLSAQGCMEDVKLRVLHDGVPAAGAPVPCEATVEDGYMEMLRQLERGAGK